MWINDLIGWRQVLTYYKNVKAVSNSVRNLTTVAVLQKFLLSVSSFKLRFQ